MDKERLEQYRFIEAALKSIRKDLAAYSRNAERSQGRLISDVAKGSSLEFPYTERRIKIESYDHTAHDKWLRKLKLREAEYEEILKDTEEWLEKINDPIIYSIFRLKLKDNLTNQQIGNELGYSRSRITQIINAYLKNKD